MQGKFKYFLLKEDVAECDEETYPIEPQLPLVKALDHEVKVLRLSLYPELMEQFLRVSLIDFTLGVCIGKLDRVYVNCLQILRAKMRYPAWAASSPPTFAELTMSAVVVHGRDGTQSR